MNLTLTVLEIVSPVFLLAGIGFAWVRLGFEYRVAFVTRMSMTLSVPCLIFTALMQSDVSPAALTSLTLASIAAYAVITALFAGGLTLARLEQRTYLAPLIYGNTGNLGLPLALFAFGQDGLGLAIVVFAIMAVLSFTFGVWVVSGGGNPVSAIKEPMVGATLLGALFLWQGWETPRFMTNTLELIGQMAIPMMLITLGVAVARLTPGRVGQAVILAVIKLIVCTAAAWYLGQFFGLSDIALAVLVMQVATPVAVTSYLLAEKYGADADAVAGLVVMSTLISVAALPLLLAFLL